LIGILDYGLGNILAFQNIFKRVNVAVTVVSDPDELARVSKLVLPGVGAFDHAMDLFERSGLRRPVEDRVLGGDLPVIGVCVGMQMLAESSDEGVRPGLGWVPGRVLKLDGSRVAHATRLPHMGWNDVRILAQQPLFDGLSGGWRFYFLHSYYFEAASARSVLAVADYGGEFACAVQRENVYGVQFHPEKSHHFGAMLLKNFAERA